VPCRLFQARLPNSKHDNASNRPDLSLPMFTGQSLAIFKLAGDHSFYSSETHISVFPKLLLPDVAFNLVTMDPLAITASVITLATLAARAADALNKFRRVCAEVPAIVHALSNEVADLHVVLQQLTAIVKERRYLIDGDQCHIQGLSHKQTKSSKRSERSWTSSSLFVLATARPCFRRANGAG
jgi:hypothetical protein